MNNSLSAMSSTTREHILSCGGRIIHHKGFTATGLQEILQAAEVPKGSFYFYFKSKEELIHELFREVHAKLEIRILEPFPADMSLRDRLLRTLANLLRYFLENPTEFKFLEQYFFSSLGEQEIRKTEEKQTILQLLLQAREQGLIKDAPLLVLEAIVFGPITALAREHANRGTPIDETMCRLTIEACWDGVNC